MHIGSFSLQGNRSMIFLPYNSEYHCSVAGTSWNEFSPSCLLRFQKVPLAHDKQCGVRLNSYMVVYNHISPFYLAHYCGRISPCRKRGNEEQNPDCIRSSYTTGVRDHFPSVYSHLQRCLLNLRTLSFSVKIFSSPMCLPESKAVD